MLISNLLNFEMDSCEICEKNFSTNKCKHRHISIVHGEVKNFECSVCSKKFGTKQELTIHRENNHNITNQNCKFCGKVFARSGSLSEHIKNIHERTRNFKCDLKLILIN